MLHPVSDMRVLREGRRNQFDGHFSGFNLTNHDRARCTKVGAPRYNSIGFQTMRISCNRENDRFHFGARVSVRIRIMLRGLSAAQITSGGTWPVPEHVSTAGLAHADIAIWSAVHTCETTGLRLHDGTKVWSRHGTETASEGSTLRKGAVGPC